MRLLTTVRSLVAVSAQSTAGKHPVLVDGLLAIATAIAFLGAAVTSPEQAARDVGLISIVFAVLLGGALLFRRRWPLGVFVYSIAVITVYMALDFPAVGLAFPLAASLYTAARYGRGVPAAWIAGVAVIMGLIVRTVIEPETPLFVAVNMAQEGVGLAAALLLGETVRSRRALARETRARLALVETEQQLEAERRVIDERMEIARDLHDVIAHTVTVIRVQANLAADAFDATPNEAREAVASIQKATGEALTDLRSAVAVLRQGERAPLLPAPGLEGLDDLIAVARTGGLEVELHTDGLGEVPAIVAVAVYRVIQEALTNVLRHSQADTVEISVERHDSQLLVTVNDNGRGSTETSPMGYGISGMSERVGSLGGRLHIGNRPGGGFRVEAEIPLGAVG